MSPTHIFFLIFILSHRNMLVPIGFHAQAYLIRHLIMKPIYCVAEIVLEKSNVFNMKFIIPISLFEKFGR